MTDQFCKKRLLQSDIFHISFNHSYRNAKNHREKSWQDVSVNLPKNIAIAEETMTQTSYIYFLGLPIHIFNFIFKTSQY